MPQANRWALGRNPFGIGVRAEVKWAVLGDPERCSGLVYGVPLGHGAWVNGAMRRRLGVVRRGRGKAGTVLFRG